jgi:hypothetical protein
MPMPTAGNSSSPGRSITVLSWRCQECASTKVTQLLPRFELTSALSVSLKCYLELLTEGRQFDERYENLNQIQWLLANWSFDDSGARYSSTS